MADIEHNVTGATLVSHDPATPPEPPPIVLPPANVDAPYVGQTGANLNCTMGNWQNEPTAYAYQWRRDGIDIMNATTPDHAVLPEDVGYPFDCVLTATNSAGQATVASNVVVVTAP